MILNGAEQYWNLYQDGVTQGLLYSFRSCPEKIRLGFIQGLTGSGNRGTQALDFGSLFHKLLDQTYSHYRNHQSDLDDTISFMMRELSKSYESDHSRMMEKPLRQDWEIDNLEENYAMAEILLPRYFNKWVRDFKDYNWLHLEKQFDVPYDPKERLGLDKPPIRIRGKRDGEFTIGKPLWLFETKTKGRIEEESISDTLSMNFQVQLYLWSMRMEYRRWPAGVVYNVVRRPLLRRGKQETLKTFAERCAKDIDKRPEFYFIRFNSNISREEQLQWERGFDQLMYRLIQWYDGWGHFLNDSACTGSRGPCGFLRLCCRNDVHAYKQREHIFPELEGEED